MATSGTLIVKVVEARLTRDAETFGTQDPYVEIEHRMEKFKTKVATDGGKNPKFNEEFTYNVKYIGDDFHMRIMNKNVIQSDDVLAQATIKVSGLCVNGGMDDWWKVQYKGKDGGSIHFIATWQPAGQAGQAQLAQKTMQIDAMKQQQMALQMQQ
jgi:Ca2+-dependent lipid-binding protein